MIPPVAAAVIADEIYPKTVPDFRFGTLLAAGGVKTLQNFVITVLSQIVPIDPPRPSQLPVPKVALSRNSHTQDRLSRLVCALIESKHRRTNFIRWKLLILSG
jgi:hypothetical protein